MVLSAPWEKAFVIISLQLVKKLLGINPMVLSFPWAKYNEIIALDPVNNNF